MSVDEVDSEIEECLLAFAAKLEGFALSWKRVADVVAAPGKPAGLLYATTVDVWERVAGRAHEPSDDNSGASDANLLRAAGIETVKVGMPKVTAAGHVGDFHGGMNTVSLSAIADFARLLSCVTARVCGTTRAAL
jgi:hypothetical protein